MHVTILCPRAATPFALLSAVRLLRVVPVYGGTIGVLAALMLRRPIAGGGGADATANFRTSFDVRCKTAKANFALVTAPLVSHLHSRHPPRPSRPLHARHRRFATRQVAPRVRQGQQRRRVGVGGQACGASAAVHAHSRFARRTGAAQVAGVSPERARRATATAYCVCEPSRDGRTSVLQKKEFFV